MSSGRATSGKGRYAEEMNKKVLAGSCGLQAASLQHVLAGGRDGGGEGG